MELQVFFALIPILSIILLLILFQWPVKKSMFWALLITIAISIFYWKVPLLHLSAAATEGIVVATSILWILLGAILMLEFMIISGAFQIIRSSFMRISNDRYILIIIISWFLGAFMEGIAGFGTPAAICAPLLVAVGFRPLESVILSLIANSIPVAFGAAGTPLIIGLESGIPQIDGNYEAYASTIAQIGTDTAFLNIFSGSLVPLLLLIIYATSFDKRHTWKHAFRYWDIAIFAGISFTTISYLIARYIGPEFPSMLGAPLSLMLTIILFKKKYQYNAVYESDQSTAVSSYSYRDLLKAWAPYVWVITLLLISRLDELPLKAWLLTHNIVWQRIFSTSIGATFPILYSPGTFFMIVVLIIWRFYLPYSRKTLSTVYQNTMKKVLSTLPVMLTSVPLVRIFIFSDVNTVGLLSMPGVLAHAISELPVDFLPLASILIGALGSFLSGSATFSNMMFAYLQYEMATTSIKISPIHLLTLQTIGASIGNMICIVNIIAACAVVGIKNQEGIILRNTFLPALLITLIAFLVYTIGIKLF